MYIPPQAPGPGQACRTTSTRCSSVILPTVNAPSFTSSSKAHEKKFKKSQSTQKKRLLKSNDAIFPTRRLTVRFKRVRDIDRIALLVSHRRAIDVSLAGLYRAAVHDDRRTVVSHRGHRAAWHVLVASGQGYIAVVVLGLEGGESEHLSPLILFSSSYQCDLYLSSTQREVWMMSQGLIDYGGTENRKKVEVTYRFDGVRDQVTAR